MKERERGGEREYLTTVFGEIIVRYTGAVSEGSVTLVGSHPFAARKLDLINNRVATTLL